MSVVYKMRCVWSIQSVDKLVDLTQEGGIAMRSDGFDGDTEVAESELVLRAGRLSGTH